MKRKEYERYEVRGTGTIYDLMIGSKVGETDKTYILEFGLGEKMGGVNRVHFHKIACMYEGKY